MNKKIAIIMGTTRPSRISPTIAKWAQSILNKGSLNYDLIDLKKINLPFLDEPKMPMLHEYQNEATLKWSQLIQSYDGIIFLFPQYNWGYPGVLKNAIDFLGTEWNQKPVSCITYGFHGGTQAYSAMLLVINGLKMQRMSVNPSISINAEMFNEHGFKDVNQSLKPYEKQIELLRSDFEQHFI